jgi:serine/threonine-protein kinase
MLQEGALAGGRFRLVRPIGEGGMACVWWAHDEQQGGEVAVKIAHATDERERTARFLREAKLIRRCRHRNIVGIVDAGELADEGMLFLAMELLRGSPLSDRLAPGEPLPAEEVLPVLIEVCRGLEAAHGAGVIHRDIKPENIFLAVVPGEGVVPKILDFGVGKAQGSRPHSRITIQGEVLGTPGYMSPEQAMARTDLGPATDLWSVGVILYEAVTGKLPFSGRNPAALLDSIVGDEPAEVSAGVDARTRAVIARCLQKDPGLRYPDAASLRADMERALEALAPGADPQAAPQPAEMGGSRRGALLDPAVVGSEPPTTQAPRHQRQALARAGSPLLIVPLAAALCLVAIFAVPRRRLPPQLEAGLARAARSRAAALPREQPPAHAHSGGVPAVTVPPLGPR